MSMEIEIIQMGLSMIKSGLVKGTWGNISGRRGDVMLITPSGIPYEEMEPEHIAQIDVETGRQVGGSCKASSEQALHLVIYQNLPDVQGVVHTHSIYASAFAAIHEPVPCLIEDQAQIIGGDIPVARYAPPGTVALGERVMEALGEDRYAALLANHGLVAVGRSLREAWTAAEIAEKSAYLASIVKSMNKSPVVIDPAEIREMRKNYLENYSRYSV